MCVRDWCVLAHKVFVLQEDLRSISYPFIIIINVFCKSPCSSMEKVYAMLNLFH